MLFSKPVKTTRPLIDTKTRVALAALALVVAASGALGCQIRSSQITTSSAHYAELAQAVAALPAPWSKKLVWTFFGESPEVEGGHALRKSLDFLPFAGTCNVVLRPGVQSLGEQSALSSDMQKTFFLLHEKGHCLSDANNDSLRPGLVVPEVLEVSATPKLLKDVAEESYADSYGVLWLAKQNPELAAVVVDDVVSFREKEWAGTMVSSMTPWLIATLKERHKYPITAPDDHYTVPALEVLKGELAKMSPAELANLSGGDIRAIACRVSLESVSQYTRALDPNR